MKNPIDMIFDENDNGNIVLFNENNEAVEFEQIAVIPLNGEVYVILKPVAEMLGLAEDEALVFCITETEGEESLTVVADHGIVDQVFDAYYELLDEEG